MVDGAADRAGVRCSALLVAARSLLVAARSQTMNDVVVRTRLRVVIGIITAKWQLEVGEMSEAFRQCCLKWCRKIKAYVTHLRETW